MERRIPRRLKKVSSQLRFTGKGFPCPGSLASSPPLSSSSLPHSWPPRPSRRRCPAAPAGTPCQPLPWHRPARTGLGGTEQAVYLVHLILKNPAVPNPAQADADGARDFLNAHLTSEAG